MAIDSTPPVTDRSAADSSPPSIQVVMAVADAAGRSQGELPPLHEAIDPEALDRLFAPTVSEERRTRGRVVFEYAGYEIEVDGSGGVTVRPVEGPSSSHRLGQ